MNTEKCLLKIAQNTEASLDKSLGTPAERKEAVTNLYEFAITNNSVYEGMPSEKRLIMYQMHMVMLDMLNAFELLNGKGECEEGRRAAQ